jgi:hypothetical protein
MINFSLSAQSSDLPRNGQMLVMGTTEDPTDPIRKFMCSQVTLRFCDLALAVYPLLGLDGVKARTLLGQKAAYDPHSGFAAALFDLSVVLSEPVPYLPGDVPTLVVPDEEQYLLARRLELFQ